MCDVHPVLLAPLPHLRDTPLSLKTRQEPYLTSPQFHKFQLTFLKPAWPWVSSHGHRAQTGIAFPHTNAPYEEHEICGYPLSLISNHQKREMIRKFLLLELWKFWEDRPCPLLMRMWGNRHAWISLGVPVDKTTVKTSLTTVSTPSKGMCPPPQKIIRPETPKRTFSNGYHKIIKKNENKLCIYH